MILAGGVGGSGILFIGWVGSRGRCRSKVGTPAKEHNPASIGMHSFDSVCHVVQ
eukprot:COSAG02_NODE_1056_length_14925_cov_84.064212_8_plen_54_part_00